MMVLVLLEHGFPPRQALAGSMSETVLSQTSDVLPKLQLLQFKSIKHHSSHLTCLSFSNTLSSFADLLMLTDLCENHATRFDQRARTQGSFWKTGIPCMGRRGYE